MHISVCLIDTETCWLKLTGMNSGILFWYKHDSHSAGRKKLGSFKASQSENSLGAGNSCTQKNLICNLTNALSLVKHQERLSGEKLQIQNRIGVAFLKNGFLEQWMIR